MLIEDPAIESESAGQMLRIDHEITRCPERASITLVAMSRPTRACASTVEAPM